MHDFVAGFDAVDHVQPPDDLAKHAVQIIQAVFLVQGDEELAAVRVRAVVGHRHHARRVMAQGRVELVGKRVAGPAVAEFVRGNRGIGRNRVARPGSRNLSRRDETSARRKNGLPSVRFWKGSVPSARPTKFNAVSGARWKSSSASMTPRLVSISAYTCPAESLDNVAGRSPTDSARMSSCAGVVGTVCVRPAGTAKPMKTNARSEASGGVDKNKFSSQKTIGDQGTGGAGVSR